MPYENQRATGEALISLQQSKIFKEFTGRISKPQTSNGPQILPTEISPSEIPIERVIAIDGSRVTELIRNGFPGAEASLIQLALVYIDLRKLKNRWDGKTIPPKAFNEMDSAYTLQTVLPGKNIVREDGLSPKDFFRTTVFESLQGKVVQSGHETLLETYEDLVAERTNEFKCPNFENCGERLNPTKGQVECPCKLKKPIFSTDQLRFHEMFNEIGPNGEAHGQVMQFLELILLLNVLKYFLTTPSTIKMLPKIAFVFDGPLAAFGHFAAIAPRIQRELCRINSECLSKTGHPLILFSLIKSGQFVEHFNQLDYDQQNGPGKKYSRRSVLLPSIKYIHRNIVYRPSDAKEWGKDIYFGRMVLYKSNTGQRMVINTAMTTEESMDLNNTSISAYNGLADILGVVDRLSTYLFESGFIPIVRAHSHAAIPLQIGGEILRELFDENK